MDAPADTAEALFAAASRQHEAARFSEAGVTLRRLLAIEPSHAGGLNLLGITLGQQGDLAAGCKLVEQALAAAPDHPIYLRNLCELRRQNDDPAGALAAGRRAIAVAPHDLIAHLNLAMAEQDALELDAAEANARFVLAAEPDHGSAHFLLAQLALLRGDYAQGWREYAWRWKIPGAEQPRPPIPVPEWGGAPVEGRLLLIADQGFGDIMQFARYMPWARARCQSLAVCCPAELVTLLQRIVPDATVRNDYAHAANAAAQAPFSSLPGLAGATDSFPSPEFYLSADPERMRRWSARLDQLAPGPNRRIGLAWAGRREHRGDRQRSMPLAAFAPLLALPGFTFISVQKGEAVVQVGACFGPAPLVNLGPEIEDFDDTAAILEQLDALVTVDTSVAHLAGALGRPTHVILPSRPDWRWLLGRADTPWYKSLRLWRDPAPGNRAATVAAIAEELSSYAPSVAGRSDLGSSS
jgi:tetratricopeptide (TPR) repeat protein